MRVRSNLLHKSAMTWGGTCAREKDGRQDEESDLQPGVHPNVDLKAATASHSLQHYHGQLQADGHVSEQLSPRRTALRPSSTVGWMVAKSEEMMSAIMIVCTVRAM